MLTLCYSLLKITADKNTAVKIKCYGMSLLTCEEDKGKNCDNCNKLDCKNDYKLRLLFEIFDLG